MTVEEAEILAQLAAERGGAMHSSTMTRRARAVAERMSANTNYVRIVAGCACVTEPGRAALKNHQKAFG